MGNLLSDLLSDAWEGFLIRGLGAAPKSPLDGTRMVDRGGEAMRGVLEDQQLGPSRGTTLSNQSPTVRDAPAAAPLSRAQNALDTVLNWGPMGPAATIAGVGAKFADRQALAMAERMYNSDKFSPEQILRATGWMKDASGRWMYEISDRGMKVKEIDVLDRVIQPDKNPGFYPDAGMLHPNFPPGTTLGDVVSHPELFKNYPQMEKFPLEELSPTSRAAGAWDSTKGAVKMNSVDAADLKGVLAHELTHGVQSIENFANGGNSTMFLPPKFSDRMQAWNDSTAQIMDLYRKIPPDKAVPVAMLEDTILNGKFTSDELMKVGQFAAEYPQVMQQFVDYFREKAWLQTARSTAHERYRQISGEQVAEAAARRVNLTSAQRKNRLFFEDFDEPFKLMGRGDSRLHPVTQMPPGDILPILGVEP